MRVGGPPSLFWLRLPPGSYDWPAALALLRQQLGTKERSPFTTKPLQPKVTSLESVGLQPGRGGRCCAIFRGSGFTRHLVRNWMADALAVAQGEPVAGGSHYGHRGPPAPPEGLVLWEVDYGLQAPGLEAHVGAEQPLEGNVVRAADGHAGA